MMLKNQGKIIVVVAGSGLSAGIIYLIYKKKSENFVKSTEKALSTGGNVKLRLTTYFPFQKGLSTSEQKMEGGVNDRRGKPLHTLEQHLSNPVNHPYVSLAGDDAVWPYGQRIELSVDGKPVLARVVDTGGHFRGVNKVYRIFGYEPIDVCVNSSDSRKQLNIPSTIVGKIVAGDNFEGGKAVATAELKGQDVKV